MTRLNNEANMKAVVQDSYGPPDVLELREVEVPEPAADEVLVRVHAAGLNHADWYIMRGEPYLLRLAFGLRAPKTAIRGRDVAGVVETVGAKVTRFMPGDEVYAETERGTFAEYTVVPENLLARKPGGLTFEEAAAVPLAGVTALQALRDAGRVQPGHRVLINGASGGVGTFAVQIAKALGADVTGVCSPRNVERARALGADRVVDYTRDDFVQLDSRFDVILDLVGNRMLADCRRALAPEGTLVLVAGGGSRLFGPVPRMLRAAAISPLVKQTFKPFMATPSAEDLDAFTKLVESGAVRPVVEAVYPLAETGRAMRHLGEQRARAKIVVTV